MGAMTAAVLVCLVSVQDTGNPRPRAQDPEDKAREHAARVTAERAANQRAYERDYLPLAQQWRDRERGGWLVIAQGVVLPRKGDAIEPAPTLAQADADARANFPLTAHRFVIQIGDEGDQQHRIGMAAGFEPLAGSGFTRVVGGVLIHPNGVQVRRGGVRVEIGMTTPKGGAYLVPDLSAPRDGEDVAKITKPPLRVSNIFPGAIVITAATALELGLANWEIPGRATLYPGYKATDKVEPHAHCRRVWLRARIAAIGGDHTVAAAVWPAKNAREATTRPRTGRPGAVVAPQAEPRSTPTGGRRAPRR